MPTNDPYSAYALKQAEDEKDKALSTSINFAAHQDPDVYAKTTNLSRDSGLPLSVVRQEKETADRIVKRKEFVSSLESVLPAGTAFNDLLPELQKTSPNVAKYLSDPKNAAVSFDEVHKLVELDKILNTPSLPEVAPGGGTLNMLWKSAIDLANNYLNILPAQVTAESFVETEEQIQAEAEDPFLQQLREAGSPLATEIAAREDSKRISQQEGKMDTLESTTQRRIAWENHIANNPELQNSELFQRFVTSNDPAELLQMMQDHFFSLSIEGAASSGANMLPIGAGSIVGYATGGMIGSSIGSGAASFSIEFPLALDQAMQEAGYNPYDPEDLIRAVKDEETMNVIKAQAATKALSVAVYDALAMSALGVNMGIGPNPIIRKMTNAAVQMAIQMGSGAGGEAQGQYLSGVVGDIEKGMDPMEAIRTGWERHVKLGEVAMEGLAEPGASVVEATVGGYHLISEQNRAAAQIENEMRQGATDQKILDQAIKLGQESKTRERDRVVFQDAVKTLAPDDQRVYIPVEAFEEVETDSLIVLDQVEKKKEQGGDVILTMDEFMTDIAPDEAVVEATRDVMRLGSNSLNQAELSEQGELFQDVIEETSQIMEEEIYIKKVSQDKKDQLVQANIYSVEDSAKLTATIESAIRTKYKRMQETNPEITVEEVADMYDELKIESDMPKPMALKQDFGDITIQETVVSKGELYETEVPAQKVWDDVQKRKGMAERLMDCL